MKKLIPYIIILQTSIISGCFESEPEFWEKEDYISKGKPEDTEYFLCGYSKLIEVVKNEGVAKKYSYNSNIYPTFSLAQFNELPEPDAIEEILEMKRETLYDGSVRYIKSKSVWEGGIQGCALPKSLYMTFILEPKINSSGEAYISYTQEFKDLYIDPKEQRNKNCNPAVIQTIAENSAIRFREENKSCKSLPDTYTFDYKRNEFRDTVKRRAVKYKDELHKEIVKELQEIDSKSQKLKDAAKSL
ncbi:MAG: hypothetical protein GJ671_09545 [Alteromonadaceae bacterium]|nr:hypothetical protein [Alteromonadaceae bacterium]